MKTAHLKEALDQTLVPKKKIIENKKGASKINEPKKKSVKGNKKMKSNIQYTCQLCETFKTEKKISLEIHCRKTHLTCLICCKKFKDYSEVQYHLENHENHVKYQKSARKTKNQSKEVGNIFENHAKKSRKGPSLYYARVFLVFSDHPPTPVRNSKYLDILPQILLKIFENHLPPKKKVQKSN